MDPSFFLILLLNSLHFTSSQVSNRESDIKGTTLSEGPKNPGKYTNRTDNVIGFGMGNTLMPNADISDYKYMMAISYRMTSPNGTVLNHMCSGAYLYGFRYVITSAHCVVIEDEKGGIVDKKYVSLRYGSNLSDSGGLVARVSNIYVHPLYTLLRYDVRITRAYDVAVIEAAADLKGADMEPLFLPSHSEGEAKLVGLENRNAECEVIGYGISKDRSPQQLVAAKINLLATHDCAKMVEDLNWYLSADTHVCAHTESVNPCHSNGGAILVCPDLPGPSGIFSFGKDCGVWSRPAVFSRVDNLMNFLQHPSAKERAKASSGAPRLSPSVGLKTYGVLLFLEIVAFKAIEMKLCFSASQRKLESFYWMFSAVYST